ncbi:MAG: IS630 family transposase [Chloroflexi bacterium]|nr:IS630 family transposase [Chloroflexota bacterium]
MANRAAPPLPVSEEERSVLRSWTRAGTTEQRQALRARIVLRAAEGRSHTAIAGELGCSIQTVLLWRQRFRAAGLSGLADAPHPGRPATYDSGFRQQLIATTLTQPADATHWSTRRLAKAVGASRTTVARIWKAERLKPHRVETFKFSRDPELGPKVVDIVGLYLHPPDGAIVLCVDEKTQIQALERTQPMLPLRPGQVERRSHDYKRNGTLSLYAALELSSGEVTGKTTARHRAKEFLGFMRLLVRRYPTGELHVVLDNSSTHKTPAVERWLRRHKRVHFHFTPTSASWMNQVETWFSVLQRQALERGSFEGVRALGARIDRYIRDWDEHATPFVWVKTADEILAKAVRKPQDHSGTDH